VTTTYRVSYTGLVRPPGTVVPGGPMFYSWCFFIKFATRSPSSLSWSPWNFITWSISECAL